MHAHMREPTGGVEPLTVKPRADGERSAPPEEGAGTVPGTVSDRREQTRHGLLLTADVVSLGAAFVACSSSFTSNLSVAAILVTFGLWIGLTASLGLYTWDLAAIDSSTVREAPRLAQAVLMAAGATFLLEPGDGLVRHRLGGLLFVTVLWVAMLITRALARTLTLRLFGPQRALIVGHGKVADVVARKLQTHASYGIEVVGYVGADRDDARPSGAFARLGTLAEIPRLCREQRIKRLIITNAQDEALDVAIRKARGLGVRVTIVPRLVEVLGGRLALDEVEGMTALSIDRSVLNRPGLAAKRLLDIVGASVGLLLLSPLLAIIALAIKLDSSGPAIFSQVRIGRGGKPFRIHKFRTMVPNADKLTAEIAHLSQIEYPLLRIPEDQDPRLTRVGRLLRKTMLDETPQLINVLRGEMSLVGPRPLEPQDDAEVKGWQRARLGLPPGITGPWQALGRHAIPFSEMLTLDCLYVSDWTLWRDVMLLIRTAQIVVLRSRPG